jgi:two-component system, OmpR family, sensor kinase
MTLRWRLILSSTLILGLVFAFFGIIAYFAARHSLYTPVDDNLENQMSALKLYIGKTHRLPPQLTDPEQIGSVTFTVFDAGGNLISGSSYVPKNDGQIIQAYTEGEAWGTLTLPGTEKRLRIYLSTIDVGVETLVVQASSPLEIADEILARLSWFLAIAAPILLIIAAAGAYTVAGRALQVVNNVTERARQIETSKDLTQRIPEPPGDDEIGNLVKTFNQMLARLNAAFEAQRLFVADSSHELRTPLTVIRGNLHLLRRTDDGGERAQLISVIEAETSRLNRMVNDLLYMAQMQAGYDVKPVLRTVELDSLLLDVFSLARSVAALKDQRVLLVHEDVAVTRGDREQLQHLLLNLVDNAAKYTPAGGTITLGLWAEQDWSRIEVSDSGPGIARQSLPFLFERFYRTQEARRNELNGSGLGLAIVKSIAEAHNGKVEVFSELGQGSTFRVWLPVPQAQPAPSEDGTDEAAQKGRITLTVPMRQRPARRRIQEGTWPNT